MSFVIVVETAGRRQVQPVTLTPGAPVRVGRGWRNDVILFDEYSDAEHLEFTVDDDGALRVVDLTTRNGSRLVKRRLLGSLDYLAGSPVTIGDSTVTLHDAKAGVAPAQKLDAAHVASRRFGGLSWSVLATMFAVAALLGSVWFASPLEVTHERLASELLGAGVFAVGWCLAAGLVGKLFRGRTYLGLHWMHLCLAVVLAVGGGLLIDVLRFNLDADRADTWLTQGSVVLLLLAFVYGTLSLCTRLGNSKKLAAAGALAVIPTAFALLGPLLAEEHERWTPVANVERVILPPVLRVGSPVSLDAHLASTDALFARLDAEVSADAPGPELGPDIDAPHGDDVRFSELD